jgi:hypothetical protein
MKHLFSWIAGVAMLSVSFIPAVLPAPFWWKVGLTGCALLGAGAFGLHLLAQYREDKKREEKEREREARESARDEKERKREETQEERDRLLIHKAIEEFKLSNVATSIVEPSVALPAELGMSADDPRLYLEIEQSTDAMFRRTPFILHNRGKDVAHAAQIQSFKLKRKEVTFPSIEAIPAGDKKDILPTIKSHEPMNEHDIFHWLLKDWDVNGELLEEWPIPLTIEYWDFSKKKKFAVTMNLVFHAIRYLLDEKHGGQQRGWPPRNYARPLWEFRDIQFKRVS